MVPVPLYDKKMAVDSYLFRYQSGNDLFSTAQATNIFDGASRSPALEMVNAIGLDAFTLGKSLFIPISYIALLSSLDVQCQQPPDRVIFLLEEPPPPEEPYLSKMLQLQEKGYQFAVRNLTQPNRYHELLTRSNYYFLSQRNDKTIEASERILFLLKRHYPNLQFVATNIHSQEVLDSLHKKGFALYESKFYRVPVTQGAHHNVSPLKANAIRLINTVQDENFEFESVTQIVRNDPSLTISLLQILNAPQYRKRGAIKSVQQAVAMLGQQEVRKWVTTAVTKTLSDDRPSEITRISMVRAKFAENLAPLFEMAHMAQELFLMGLFSVLDVILELPMEEALKMVMVSDMIRKALLDQAGLFAPVLELIGDYENANWPAVSRQMILHSLDEDSLSTAYTDALIWYRNVTMVEVDEETVMEEASGAGS